MSTSLKQAFESAGYIDPVELAYEAAMAQALAAWTRWSGADGGASRAGMVRQFLSKDPTWAVLERCSPQVLKFAVAYLLQDAERRIRGNAPRTATPEAADRADDGARGGGDRNRSDDPIAAVPAVAANDSPRANDGPTPRHYSPEGKPRTARTAAALHVHAVLNPLDFVRVDGTPIGDLTVGAVRTWAERRTRDAAEAGRDARFALALTANLESGQTLRTWYRNADDVLEVWRRAGDEHGV